MNIERIHQILEPKKTERVLYIMHNTFRINDNHSVEYIRELPNTKKKDVLLIQPFDQNPNIIQYFKKQIENFKEVFGTVFDTVTYQENRVIQIKEDYDLVVMDYPYLKEEKLLLKQLQRHCRNQKIGLLTIESNVMVPTLVTSDKEEYSARTIRPKIWKKVELFLDNETNYTNVLIGEQNAYSLLDEFVEHKLEKYHLKNHPELDVTSNLSPYLKYGFISPQRIYNRIQMSNRINYESFLEELIIRRELSYNFVAYNEGYDLFESITYPWAYQTMKHHEYDKREYLYTIEDYISFNTHDPYFNAAMKEMIYTGYMHGYMRMYWCKKIIEWSRSYKEAYDIAIYLNNYYFLDGNTPNGYTGVAWCFGKHDRAWTERFIFGKLRYMNQNGLKRKFDIETYVSKMEGYHETTY